LIVKSLDVRRNHLRKSTLAQLIAILGTSAYYAYKIEPEQTDVAQISLTLPRLDPAFDGYKIIQISDLHVDKYMTRRRLYDHVHRINSLKPDLIAITGDFVTRKVHYNVDDLVVTLSELRATDGVVAIPGNHDYSSGGIDRIRQIWRDCEIIDLSNTFRTIEREGSALHIAGLDDVIHRVGRLDLVLNQLPTTDCAILLAHEPDVADLVAPTRRFDLQLSGHTHGGQIRLPLIGSLVGPKQGKRYGKGLYRILDMQLYVNRGLGMVTAPVRFNCPPEISVFTLNSV
jgi:predicted MPP superfamily phosphohydrolase